ncbi:hypothetical protein [Streptomyces sp. 147326]|uniref:hypothetical protein n=1 Tax=Streptomyces sp. 147326 TaxID=3074379 RepID=UPI003857EA04
MSTPNLGPQKGPTFEQGCCGGCLFIILIIMLVGALSGDPEPHYRHGPDDVQNGTVSREDCRNDWKDVGDGTVDWRGICDAR